MNIKNRTIYNKDNLDILRGINNSCIDLIYLDPPFNKNKEFTAPIGSSSEGASFKDWFREEDVKDDWLQEIKEDYDGLYKFLSNVKELSNITQEKKSKHYLYNYCYLCYMAVRLLEMRRILKDTGSIYLHCDNTMGHYLKILMDIIFGEKNFLNSIIWKRTTSHNDGKRLGKIYDIIFFYSKTKHYKWNDIYVKYDDESFFKYKDKRGDYYWGNLTAPLKTKNKVSVWKDLDPSLKNRMWSIPRKLLSTLSKEKNVDIEKMNDVQKLDFLYDNDCIKLPSKRGEWASVKTYKDKRGKKIQDLFLDINGLTNFSKKERTGYPTQKPIALLDRIVKASTNKGDMILDPFCGCSTTCVASEKLGRQWVGIDISVKAYELVKERLKKEVQGINEQGTLDATKHQENDYDKEVKYTTTPPNRTDLSEDDRIVKKYVYIISHPNHKGYYKVGIASNKKQRLNSYQTGDPLRQYKMEYDYLTPCFREIEKHIHDTFPNLLEWVQSPKEEIVKEIEGYEKNK